MKMDPAAMKAVLEAMTPRELAVEYTRVFGTPAPPDAAIVIDHILAKPGPTSAELIAELNALQLIGDEIRERMETTMAELKENAEHVKAATKRAEDS
jgi:hypothetical protein